MRKRDVEVLKATVQQENEWMRRAVIFDKVLRHLGFDTTSIMQCSGMILANVVLKEPEDIIHDCQMHSQASRGLGPAGGSDEPSR